MSEYFIRLATLLGTDFPEKLPVLGYIAKNVGVRQWRETWNDNAVVISAEAVIDAAISWEKGGFQFSVGNAVGGQTFFRLEIADDRSSLLTAIADRGEEMAGVTDPPPRDGLQIFARADSPLTPSRITSCMTSTCAFVCRRITPSKGREKATGSPRSPISRRKSPSCAAR